MLRSPLHYMVAGKMTMDLSQLVEVGEVYWGYHSHFESYSDNEPHTWPGFYYRYASSPEPLMFRRVLRRGPNRLETLELETPSQQLQCVGEEYYCVVGPHPSHPNYNETKAQVIVHHPKHDVPAVIRHMEADRLRLINAWQKWKAAEPEIYAIMRKHLL